MSLPLAFGAIDWAIIAAYMLVVLGMGALASRGQEDSESYWLGGRNMPTWAVTLSIVATSLSAATYVGVPQLTYREGGDLSYLILNIGGVLGALWVAVFFLPRLYRAGTTTIYGVLGQRWGPGATLAASVAFLFGRLLASGARLFMAGIAFSLILTGELNTKSIVLAVIVFGVIGTIYTAMGGIRAVIWTDTLQIVLVVGAAIGALAFLLHEIPLSVGEIMTTLDDNKKLQVVKTGFVSETEWTFNYGDSMTLFAAFVVLFQNAGSYGCDQDLVQRMMTTKSGWRASVSLMLSQLVAMPVVFLFMVIGLLLSIYYGQPDLMGAAAPTDVLLDDRGVYPQFLVNHMPAGLAGLAMAGMFAAAMSSLDSAINAMAASLVADIYEPLRRTLKGEAGKSETSEIVPVAAESETPEGAAEPAIGSPVEAGTDPGAIKTEKAGGKTDELKAPRIAVVATGLLLIGFAVAATYLQASGGKRLIDFALGVMTFALSGLLGVFCAALFTRRGNVYSVVAALVTGALLIVFLRWEGTFSWPYWMAIASPISFGVACAGNPLNGSSRS
ncbi:MAG: sodium:solute symporter [Planctomycetes bacterium]|nr:sodium:solute symporter [Planctomycetota bacterium]